MPRDSYGWLHQLRRAALLRSALNTACPLCGRVMRRGDALDLDHSTPLVHSTTSVGDRIVHASCNRAAGGALGSRQRQLRPSRKW